MLPSITWILVSFVPCDILFTISGKHKGLASQYRPIDPLILLNSSGCNTPNGSSLAGAIYRETWEDSQEVGMWAQKGPSEENGVGGRRSRQKSQGSDLERLVEFIKHIPVNFSKLGLQKNTSKTLSPLSNKFVIRCFCVWQRADKHKCK